MSHEAPPMSPDVAAVFASFPEVWRGKLLPLRRLIFETAANTPGIGPLEETLKWGEPAYLTAQSKSGSTIRLGCPSSGGARCAIYFNCQTDLVDTFRTLFPQGLRFEGNRAIVFEADDPLPHDALSICISAALTYHLRRFTKRQLPRR